MTYRKQQWEVPGHITVRDLILKIGMSPETVLAVRKGELVLDSEVLGDEDDIKLIAVVSGG